MIVTFRNLIWAISILCCYPLYSIGQIYLFITKQKEAEFYALINKYPGNWIVAHIFLMVSLILLVPAFIGLCHYFKNTRSYAYIQVSTIFILLSIFPLFGQFTIDLCLIELFKLPQDVAYQTLDKIQSNYLISSLFYDNSKLFVSFKYADLSLLGQIFLGMALFLCRKFPVSAKVIFIMALLLTQLGILIDPYYGRIIKRLSYTLISVSLIPIALRIISYKRATITDTSALL